MRIWFLLPVSRRTSSSDAVLIERKGVGNVAAPDRQPHEIVLHDLETVRGVMEILGDNREFPPIRGLILLQDESAKAEVPAAAPAAKE